MSSSADWDALWKRGGFNRWPNEELVRWAATLEPGSKVLEVGGGAGANLQAIESFDLEAWGVDISTEALEASVPLRRAAYQAPVSATDLPFDDGEFDAVCDIQCFQHLTQDELPLAYKEAARVLNPGGRFFEVSLVKGEEHFPDLEFNGLAGAPSLLRRAGFTVLDEGMTVRERWSKRYAYTVVECQK